MVSVTSCIDYTLGIADEIDSWSTKQAILAVQRTAKKEKRVLTQEESIELGLAARQSILKKAQETGLQVHQAIQNFHSGIEYELEEEHQGYFDAYFNWAREHQIEPILEEVKVKNFRHGYAGRLDFYGKVDGKYCLLDFKTSKSVRWTYGLQLAAYKRCLEDMGHPVETMAVIHIKPRRRGGEPLAEMVEFTTPFSVFEHLLALFRYKSSQDVYAKWNLRSDLEAIKKELELKPSSLSVQQSDVPGRQQDTQGTSPSTFARADAEPSRWSPAYSNPAGIPSPSQGWQVSLPVEEIQTSRTDSQPENQAGETSSQRTGTPPGSRTGTSTSPVSAPSYRTPLDLSPLPSRLDISDSPELAPEWSEPSNRQEPRP